MDRRGIKKKIDIFKLCVSIVNLVLVTFTFLRQGFSLLIWASKLYKYDISKYQVRSDPIGGGDLTYIHKSFTFKIRNDMNINCKDIESLSIQPLSVIGKNPLLNILYKTPSGDMEPFEKPMETIVS